jgi:single-strand DNA-binding protein
MAGSVNKVIGFMLITSETWKRQGVRRARGTHGVAPRRGVQRTDRRHRRALPDEGREGLRRGSAADRKWTDQGGQEHYTPELVLPRFKGEMTMLSRGNSGERPEADGASGGGYLPRSGHGGGEPTMKSRPRRRYFEATADWSASGTIISSPRHARRSDRPREGWPALVQKEAI